MLANFAHAPNADGLLWLVRNVTPLAWAEAPDLLLTVAGSGLAPRVAQTLHDARLRLLGHVAALRPLLAGVRLAVAPLRYGAGIKGKVLEAWAAGLPCAMGLRHPPATELKSQCLSREADRRGSIATQDLTRGRFPAGMVALIRK